MPQGWKGKVVCDVFGGYKASFELGVTELGCLAQTRRKFFELHATNKSQLAGQALRWLKNNQSIFLTALLGMFVEDPFEGFGEFVDDLGFLLLGNAVTGDAQAGKGHGSGCSGRPSG
ncbi:hypothetical protein AZH11_14195 [Pseudomonas simiae]|nr:hypothetical protein AZH11_14195 [Pseudomonas simiae]